MRAALDALVTKKSLEFMSVHAGCSNLLDAVADGLIGGEEGAEAFGLKNVCAKVHPDLDAEISKVCDLLGMRKRAFLEAAFIDAVAKAHEIMSAEGVLDTDWAKGEPA